MFSHHLFDQPKPCGSLWTKVRRYSDTRERGDSTHLPLSRLSPGLVSDGRYNSARLQTNLPTDNFIFGVTMCSPVLRVYMTVQNVGDVIKGRHVTHVEPHLNHS